jgi:hypothetical protein
MRDKIPSELLLQYASRLQRSNELWSANERLAARFSGVPWQPKNNLDWIGSAFVISVAVLYLRRLEAYHDKVRCLCFYG